MRCVCVCRGGSSARWSGRAVCAGLRNVTARVRGGVARDGGRLRGACRWCRAASRRYGCRRNAHAVDGDAAAGMAGVVVLCLVSLSYACTAP